MSELDKVEILGGLLKRIGNFSPTLFEKSFDSRLIFQKTIYLLQSFGLYVGFPFSWYIRGPYSTELAKKGYELTKKFAESPIITFSRRESEERFHTFLNFLGERKDNAEWLEILASIHFLRSTYHKAKKEIMEMVIRKQPYLTLEECEKAWKHLQKFDLIS